MPIYHPNSVYGKLTAIINSDKCLCGNSKKVFTPFCYGCFDELNEGEFPVKKLYRNGESLLEAMLDAVHELRFEEKLDGK